MTANDNRGGLATTAFIVTVKGQNRAPTISPILAQALDVGQTLDVAVAVSDPDGDHADGYGGIGQRGDRNRCRAQQQYRPPDRCGGRIGQCDGHGQ